MRYRLALILLLTTLFASSAYAQFLSPGERAGQRIWMLGDCSWNPAKHTITCKSVNGISWPSSGTSGAIPYFVTTSSIASSGLLAQNGIMIGGGVGGAPATITACTDAQLPVGQSGAPVCRTAGGDVTMNDLASFTIAPNAVSNAKFRQSAALSLVGNCSNTNPANVADVTGTASQVMVVNDGGTACVWGQVNLGASAAVENVGYGLAQIGGTLQAPLIAAFAQAALGAP